MTYKGYCSINTVSERVFDMARESWLTAESRTTLVFMFFGLTAWYFVQIFAESDVLNLAVLLGVGVVLPLVINEARNRSTTD
jgi:hypothetical protein